MRTWRTGLINQVSERVNRDIEQKHRQQKHERVDKEEKAKKEAEPEPVEQIDTSTNQEETKVEVPD